MDLPKYLFPYLEAYLDIETTGLSPKYCEITVVGIHLVNQYETRLIQLVGEDITAVALTCRLSIPVWGLI